MEGSLKTDDWRDWIESGYERIHGTYVAQEVAVARVSWGGGTAEIRSPGAARGAGKPRERGCEDGDRVE